MRNEPANVRGSPVYGGREYGTGAEINLRELAMVIRRRLNVILGVILVVTGTIVLVTLQLPKKYSSTAELLIKAPEQTLVNLQAFDTSTSSNSASIDSQISILRSRDLAGKVVDQLDLMNDPEFNSALESNAGTGVWLWVKTSIDEIAGTTWFSEPRQEAAREDKVEYQTASQRRVLVVDSLLSKISVRRQELSYVILVTAITKSPEKSAMLANTFTDAYLEHQMNWRLDTIRQTDKWLGTQLDDLGGKLIESERAVEDFRAENGLLNSSGVTLNEQQRSDANAQLIAANANLAELEARDRRVKQLVRAGEEVGIVAQIMSSNVIIEMKQQQTGLTRKLAEMSNRYGDKHPVMINARAELADLEMRIKSEVDLIIDSLEGEVLVARSRVKSIERSLATLQHGGAEDEQSRVVLNGLIREADANRLVFENLLQSSKKSTILSGTDSIEANTRKISPASVPRDPSFPKPKLIGSLALVISAFLGIGLAFVIESFDNGFKTPLQLEGALGIPNLAAIPEVQKGERTIRFRTRTLWDYLLLRPMSVFSEGLRTMRSALEMSDLDNPPKLIAVTSSVPDEGKTTTTYCMAVQAADAGLKTLIIDADFRRGALSRQLKKGKKKGLIDVVAGAARLKDVIYTVDKRSGLHFIPSGSRSRIANDIINSPRFGSLLKALKAEYDLVLFDTAPVLLVIDTPILAAQVDKTILLVAWDKTPQNVVESAFKRLRDFNVDVAGTALSLLDVRQQNRYYGDSYYGYGKEYDGYYTN